MSSSKPYDRQHLKQVLHRDDLSANLLKARDWARAHLETVLIGVLLAAAAVFGTVYLVTGSRQKDLEASKLLAEAQMIFQQAASLPAKDSGEAYNQAYAKFQAVTTAYEGTAAARPARLGMANALLAQGKGADAEREFSALDDKNAADPLAALGAWGKARALESQGKGAEAQAAYAAVAAAYPDSAVAAKAALEAQRLAKK